jgi:hypothetical protein
MMIGSKMRVNPALGDAGDMVGKSDIASVVNLCREFPNNKFFVTMLAREISTNCAWPPGNSAISWSSAAGGS